MTVEASMTDQALSIDFETGRFPGPELHATMDELRQRAPVVPTSFLGTPAWLIVDHEHLSAAFRDNDNFPPHTPNKLGIEPVIGETYYLYVGDDGGMFLSLIEPNMWNREHIGSFTLNSERKWIKI